MRPAAAYWRLVRENRNFRRLWLAQIVSEIGDWFYALAIYSLLLELTGLASSVATAVVLQVLPQTFIGPTAGVINDRFSRKRIMIYADLARAAIVLGMLLVRTRAMVWLVFPLLVLETVMAAFFEPARNAVIPNITADAGEIVRANTLSSATWSFNLAIGSTLGGIVAVLFGRDAVFILNAISFVASALLIGRMCFHEPHAAEAGPLRAHDLADFSSMLEGLRYIRTERRVFQTVFVKMGIGIMGANNVILPILGERVFPLQLQGFSVERGAMLGMSMLMGARGLGSLLGPVVGTARTGAHERRMQHGILIGFLTAAAAYLALGGVPSGWVAALLVILGHAGTSANWVFSTNLLQFYTADRFRGRVFSADMGLCMLTISLSSYVAGVAIDLGMPARLVASLNGAAMLVPAAIWAFSLRSGHAVVQPDSVQSSPE
jgi:MFS family permease